MDNDPCNGCLIVPACTEFCEEKINDLQETIKDVLEHGIERSLLFQNCSDHMKKRIRQIIIKYKNYGYVLFHKSKESKKIYEVDHNGNVKCGTRNYYINKLFK